MNYILRLLRAEIRSIIALISAHKRECLVLLAPLLLLLSIVNPFADRKIVLAADNKGSSWYQMAQSGEKYLNDFGVQLQIQTSDGTLKNAELLADSSSHVNAAFLIPGALTPKQNQEFYSLGSLDYEPIWIFYNKKKLGQIDSLKDLAHYRIGVGPVKSGRYVLTKKLFELNRITIQDNPNFISAPLSQQLESLVGGDIDGLIFIAEAFDKNVSKLMHNPDFAVFEFPDIAAYEKNISFLDAVKIPAGSIDILERLPTKDISLIAITTTLAVRRDMHAGLQLALLMAAKEVERNSQLLFFSKRNEFPAYVDPQIELSPVARHFYDLGPPAVMRYLPFWTAVFIERFWVLLVTIFAVIYPLIAYNFGAQTLRRDLRYAGYYDELIDIDKQLFVNQHVMSGELLRELNDRLISVEKALRAEIVIRNETKHKHFLLLRDAACVRADINEQIKSRDC